jgi:signal transduction histidine kinase
MRILPGWPWALDRRCRSDRRNPADGNRRRRQARRFTLFQRQFLSHLIISLLVLLLLGLAFTYLIRLQIYHGKEEELRAASRTIARLLQKEDNPEQPLQVYRSVYLERSISFVVMDPSGTVIMKDPRMDTRPNRGKTFLDSLRRQMFSFRENRYFIIDQETDPLMVWPRVLKAKSVNGEVYLFVLSRISGLNQAVREINRLIMDAGLLAFLLATAASWIVSRSMSRGVRTLQHATRRIAGGDYGARLDVKRSDELGELSRDFNTMAEQLQATSLKLEQYDKRRQQFILDVTHELRTPLTSIRGIIEGLKNHLVPPQEQEKYYAIIEKETFRLIRLINELLDTEKIESGMIALDPRPLPLGELFEVVSETLEFLLNEKGLRLLIDCPSGLQIYGDYDRITQILLNVVKNSIQFTEHGTICLSAGEADGRTWIRVEDSGLGMTEEQLAMIWERFYKADPSRAKTRGETGLGLAIVKRLVEAHRGTVQVTSTPGRGTVFLFSFPGPDSSA